MDFHISSHITERVCSAHFLVYVHYRLELKTVVFRTGNCIDNRTEVQLGHIVIGLPEAFFCSLKAGCSLSDVKLCLRLAQATYCLH